MRVERVKDEGPDALIRRSDEYPLGPYTYGDVADILIGQRVAPHLGRREILTSSGLLGIAPWEAWEVTRSRYCSELPHSL